LINSLQIVGKDKRKITISLIGAGAANVAVFRVLIAAGFPPENVIMVDTKGILHRGRDDLKAPVIEFKWQRPASEYKSRISEISNAEDRTGGIAEALRGSDVCIALAASGPGIIKPEWVAAMAKDAVVFACANPVPEIWPWEAIKAGAKIVATGRSDFPNQVNNSLGFPGIFRGVLDVAAKTVTDEMCIAASEELARCAQEKGLAEDRILPTMDDWELFPREAAAVGMKAIEQGQAKNELTKEALIQKATETIKRAREQTRTLMEHGLIAAAE
jgi:malate dehydrogenase (oxaloacetate-decarboxylating)